MPNPSRTKGAGTLSVYVLDEAGKPLDDKVLVLAVEHKPQFAEQFRIEGSGLEPLAAKLPPGLYSVQAVAAGRAVGRALATIHPREATELRLMLPRKEYKPAPLEERLQRYGIDMRHFEPQSLVLEPFQTVTLDYKTFYDRRCFVALTPQSLDDLKRWVGVSDEFFNHDEPRFGPLPKLEMRPGGSFDVADEPALAAIAREYIHGNSKPVGAFRSVIDGILRGREDAIVSVFFFRDVTINQGARLEIGKNSNVFTCNTLNIHRDGTLAVVGGVKADIGVYRVFG